MRVLADYDFDVVHLDVFEHGPAPRAPSGRSVKKRVGALVKTLSARISNSPMFARLELGDRAIVLARRRGGDGRHRTTTRAGDERA